MQGAMARRGRRRTWLWAYCGRGGASDAARYNCDTRYTHIRRYIDVFIYLSWSKSNTVHSSMQPAAHLSTKPNDDQRPLTMRR